jgi:hypothetical protein
MGKIGGAGSDWMPKDIEGIERDAQSLARIDGECGCESMRKKRLKGRDEEGATIGEGGECGDAVD